MFAKAGAKVAVTDRVRDEEAMAALNARAAEITRAGGEAIAIAVDVTDRDQIDACVAKVQDAYGRTDILFNNAGI